MTPFDNVFPALATRLLSQNGIVATVIRTTKAYDPSTSVETPTTQSYSLKITPPSDVSAGRGPNSEHTEQLGCFCDNQIEPKIGDVLTVYGRSHDVSRVSPIYSGTLVAAFQIDLD